MEAINRRSFLRRAAQTATGVAASVAYAGQKAPSVARVGRTPSDEIRICVMGIRSRGLDHMKEWSKVSGARVVALCDTDTSLFGERSAQVEELFKVKPKTFDDIRKMLEDRDIDAISIATCNHWHALATIWGCQAGKDVYCEKPACHNVFEGQKMIEAARKYKRIVQVGSQGRSIADVKKAIELVRNGAIGEVYMARGLCFKWRPSIGFKADEPVPPEIKFDLWLGPAQARPFNRNLVHYNWHWFWDFGNGDLGNQGVHQVDNARWGLGKEMPVKVSSMGGRLGYKDQGETPNTQVSTFIYEDGKMLVFEVRGLYTNSEAAVTIEGKTFDVSIGNIFYGTEGWVAIYGSEGPYDLYRNGKLEKREQGKGESHFANFIRAVRSRDYKDLAADVREGVLSADLCHLANTSYRLGRTLTFDSKTMTYPGDEEANKLLTRNYRAPFTVPEQV